MANDQEECACGHIRDEHRWYTGSCAVSDCMCFAFEPVAGVEIREEPTEFSRIVPESTDG